MSIQLSKKQYIFTVSQAAKFLGVSPDTLRNWESNGKLIPKKSAGGHRRYYLGALQEFQRKRFPLFQLPARIATQSVAGGSVLSNQLALPAGRLSDSSQSVVSLSETDRVSGVWRANHFPFLGAVISIISLILIGNQLAIPTKRQIGRLPGIINQAASSTKDLASSSLLFMDQVSALLRYNNTGVYYVLDQKNLRLKEVAVGKGNNISVLGLSMNSRSSSSFQKKINKLNNFLSKILQLTPF